VVKVALEETIACSPEEYLDFVMDVERYRQVDDKLGRILWTRRQGDVLQFKFLPKLPGFRLPPVGTVSSMRLVPGARIDVELAPLPHNALSRGMSTFRASFSCAPVDGGVRVRRTISFDFNPLVRWIFEPVLRRTLPTSVERELRLSKTALEGG
jgi:polyketide cyclase/dehydrase/lipid transport protein